MSTKKANTAKNSKKVGKNTKVSTPSNAKQQNSSNVASKKERNKKEIIQKKSVSQGTAPSAKQKGTKVKKKEKPSSSLTKITSIFAALSHSSAVSTVSGDSLTRICQIDNDCFFHSNSYVKDNISLYDFAINSWLYVLSESLGHMSSSMLSSMITMEIIDTMENIGLIKLIASADALASSIIDANLQPALIVDPSDAHCRCFAHWIEFFNLSDEHDVSIALQSLRYLKRFSPLHTEVYEDQIIKDFVNLERRIQMGDRRRFGRIGELFLTFEERFPSSMSMPVVHGRRPGLNSISYMENNIITRMRELIHTILEDYSPEKGYFSNGAINDGYKLPAAKLSAALSKGNGYISIPLIEASLNNGELLPTTHVAQFMTVNKNFKTRRAIAVEESGRQWHMQGIRRGLERCLYTKTNITLDDQGRNQQLCKRGSVSRSLATIDLSAASDHVSLGLVHACFPEKIYEEMADYRARFVQFPNGKIHSLNKFSTSGSALCFPVETIIFWAITVTACEYAWNFGASEDPFSLDDIAIYGDDIICPVWAAQTVIDFLNILDFEINENKTHFTDWDYYRESCGKEYFRGYDISTTFFPRRTLEFSSTLSKTRQQCAETIESMLSLQHRLLVANLPLSADLVSRYVRCIVPDMTESYIGDPFTDIWSKCPHLTVVKWNDNASPKVARDYQLDMEYHYTLTSKDKDSHPDLLPYANAMLYTEWLENGPKLCDDPNADIFRILEPTASPIRLTSVQGAVLRKRLYDRYRVLTTEEEK